MVNTNFCPTLLTLAVVKLLSSGYAVGGQEHESCSTPVNSLARVPYVRCGAPYYGGAYVVVIVAEILP
jgi:hypothetical protein